MTEMLDPLRMHAESNGDGAAVLVDESGGGRPSATTFEELNATANRCARAFHTLGGAPGDRLVWCGPNSLEVLTTIHAARKAGMTAVPLSYRFNAEEMRYVIDNSDATLVVVDSEQAPLVAGIRERLPKVREVVGFGGELPGGIRPWDEVLGEESDAEPDMRDTSMGGAQMIYTSGTTGKPKGALRTETDVALVMALIAELRLQPGNEVHLTTGPLYHSGPLAFAILSHTLGGSIVVLRSFDPTSWLRLVKEHRVTNTFSAPTQLKRLVNLPPGELARADLSSMRCLVANAAPVPYALKQEIVRKLGEGFLFEVYGSTELGIVTVLPPEDQLRKPGSCGKPYGGVQIKIVRDDGTEAASDEPGELFIRTALEMDGYHRSDETLDEHDDDSGGSGWKSVGDIASIDAEGYLSIRDRRTDMIISGGVNIYPAEIENVMHEHPHVLDVAVLGIPDDEWGERVHAIVQPKPDETVDLDELAAFVDARVARYKRPRSYEIRESLPRTPAGKLLKRQLRDEFWADRASPV